MAENWEIIYSTNQLYQAEMIREMMEDNEIECVIMNKQDSAYGFGEIEVCVPVENVLVAKQLIQDLESE